MYAISSDGFVNVRKKTNARAEKIGEILECFHGIGDGVFIDEGTNGWYKVQASNGRIGYANSRFLDKMTWVRGGQHPIVAKQPTPIYCESFADVQEIEDGGIFFTAPTGMIIADEYEDFNDKFYYLSTAHDGLFVPKDCVLRK